MKLFAIMKNNKFVRDMTDGERFTTNWNLIEKYTNKKSAEEAARAYGRANGAGYHVVQLAGAKD